MFEEMSYAELKCKTGIINEYEVLIGEENEVMFYLPVSIPGEADEKATFYYSGGCHGFLVKNNRTVALCNYLNPETREIVYGCETILVAECNEKKFEDLDLDLDNPFDDQFEVSVKQMSDLDILAERIMKDREV